MEDSTLVQIKQLDEMTVPQLRVKWMEVFGQETKQRHRRYMVTRLARRLQEDEFGEQASGRQTHVAEDYRTGSKRAAQAPQMQQGRIRDRRLPKDGTVITRTFKGQEVAVKVLDRGFDYEGRVFRSLSGVAKEITGTSWNGWKFFNLD